MAEFTKNINLILITLCILVASVVAEAAVEPSADVLKFSTWKNEQIQRAQNQVVRTTNQILLEKNEQEPSSKAPWGEKEATLEKMRSDLKQAKGDLQIAQELEFEDYLSVYLSKIGEDEVRLKNLAEKLTAEEVTKTLLYLQRYKKSKPQQANRGTVVGQ